MTGNRFYWVVLSLLLAGACATSGEAGMGTTGEETVPGVTLPPLCPNPDGGTCLGRFEAGVTYRTKSFDPPITYSVSEDGWVNYEDLFGNFLLIPPSNSPSGVNAGTSDCIGVYRAVLPTQPGVSACGPPQFPLGQQAGPTPEDLFDYFKNQPDLVVTDSNPTVVGGFEGVVVDIEANPNVELTTCRDEVDGSQVEVDWVISGIEGSDFDHGVVKDMTMRLYLLQDEDRVLGIEVIDVDGAPGSLESMTDVAESFSFVP